MGLSSGTDGQPELGHQLSRSMTKAKSLDLGVFTATTAGFGLVVVGVESFRSGQTGSGMRADLLLETQPAAKSKARERKPRRFLIADTGAQTCSFGQAEFIGAELLAWSLIRIACFQSVESK